MNHEELADRLENIRDDFARGIWVLKGAPGEAEYTRAVSEMYAEALGEAIEIVRPDERTMSTKAMHNAGRFDDITRHSP